MNDERNLDADWLREYERDCGTPDHSADPEISASGLLKLAAESDKVGAVRYAEAYRLVANRLLELVRHP